MTPRAVGVWEGIDGALEGPQSGRGHQPHEFVHALRWMLHAGGEANLFPQRQCSLSSRGDQVLYQESTSYKETRVPKLLIPRSGFELSHRLQEGIATDGEMAETVPSRKRGEQAFRLMVLRWPQPYRFEADRYGYHAAATKREVAPVTPSTALQPPHPRSIAILGGLVF